MVASYSGSMGRFSSDTADASKSTPSGGYTWRKSSTPHSPSSSPPTTPPSSLPSWRRRSSSSSSNESQKSWVASGNWRTSSPRQPSKVASLPKYEDAQPGDVLFLPLQLPPSDSIIHEKLGVSADQKPWGHPAVITDKFVKDGKQCVHIRLCTSFGSQRVEAHRKPEHWDLFVLADNEEDAKPHIDTRLATLVPNSGKFHKRTYVNLGWNSEYPIEFKYLERWGRTAMRFDEISTRRIIDRDPY